MPLAHTLRALEVVQRSVKSSFQAGFVSQGERSSAVNREKIREISSSCQAYRVVNPTLTQVADNPGASDSQGRTGN